MGGYQPDAAEALLIVGAGGVLGAALLASALASGRFGSVQAATAQPLASTLRGFEPLPWQDLRVTRARTAVIVFERTGHRNGRDEAYVQPQPDELPVVAQRLLDAGVRRLLVVVPHAPALLPQALKAGFASLDEGRVAQFGFEQLLFLRAAQSASAAAGASGLRRLALWGLSQLSWMVPQPELPVRAQRVAELAVELAWRLREAPPGTRVLPGEVLWQAAQLDDGGELLQRWLHRQELPPLQTAKRRW